jgi:hypothetical protein
MRPIHYGLGFFGIPLALVLIAADAHRSYAVNIPQSPPAYIGPKLYTVWNVPEPDRVSVIWIMQRFVDREARFHFIEPFDKVKFGMPFDMPEAEIRRRGAQSATEVLLGRQSVDMTTKLQALAHMTNLTEVSPWALATDAEAGRLAEIIRGIVYRNCGQSLRSSCLDNLLAEMDRWYKEESR